MDINRRKLLERIAGVGAAAAIAGCLGVQESGGGGQSTATETTTQPEMTATATPTKTTTEMTDGETETGTPTETTVSDEYSLVEPDMESGATGLLWHARNKASTEKFDETIGGFNDAYAPNIESSKIADLRKKTTTTIPAGRGPHVFEWVHDWGGEYWQRGFLSDQSGNLRVPKEMFTGAGQRAMQFKDKTIGLPRSAECPTLIYNKDKVSSPPATLSEMVSKMKDHHDPDNGQFGLAHPINTYFVSAWAQAFGGFIYDGESDELGHTTPETLKGFRVVKQQLWPYMPKDPGYNPQAAAFSSGSAAFAINGPWYLSNLDKKGINYGVTTMPEVEGNSPRPFTGVKMFYFAKQIETEPEKGKAARQFAEWYVSNEDKLLSLAKTQGFIPVHKDVAKKSDLPSHVKAFAEQVNDGVPMPSTPHMNAVWSPTKSAILKYLKGNAELKPAMQNAEKQIRNSWKE